MDGPVQQSPVFDSVDGEELPAGTAGLEVVHEGRTYVLFLSGAHRKELLDTLDVFTAHVAPRRVSAGRGMQAHRIPSPMELADAAAAQRAEGVERTQIAAYAELHFADYLFPETSGIRQDVLDGYFGLQALS